MPSYGLESTTFTIPRRSAALYLLPGVDSDYMRWRRGAQHLHGCIESDHGVASIDENAGSTFAENRNAAVGYVEQGHQPQQLEAVVGF